MRKGAPGAQQRMLQRPTQQTMCYPGAFAAPTADDAPLILGPLASPLSSPHVCPFCFDGCPLICFWPPCGVP
ncbi:hypothetical protein cyc_00889 [Cyclospora cayetanensis]|uniref:Uncharacterized protein n=1 Tax=Cyclospora cayetanensis TaxID=88456 RepID=A0A1D3D2I3_9EIME|nr:hypothetical protein cyc_00889 [Cyclospora cayetanensis]